MLISQKPALLGVVGWSYIAESLGGVVGKYGLLYFWPRLQ